MHIVGRVWERVLFVWRFVGGGSWCSQGLFLAFDFLGFSPFSESEIGGWEGIGLAFVR